MVFDPTRFPRVLTIYLELSNYPILAPKIRERMRQVLFDRRVIDQAAFEAEVEQKAIESQNREGISDPYTEEPPDVWFNRISIIRDNLTDFYFAYNLPHDLFEELLREALEERIPPQDVVLTFHPELAPWDMLFAQGDAYESMPPEERQSIEHHLKEIKVVLIKAMISDHLEYVGIAREWLDIADLKAIRSRRFGRGKIGGKAAGMMLAETILRKSGDEDLYARIHIPRSWFLGADVFYQFTQRNNLLEYSNQKYRSEEVIREGYPEIFEAFKKGTFPEDAIRGLQSILDEVGSKPLIVRSSSLLEDSFGTSFAGKYESQFCPNQGSPHENLDQLLHAISAVYASVYSPEALLYRRRMRLLDYDERMAILIQEVKGRQQGSFFFPDAAGVGFSRNQFRWNPRIDRKAGFLRLVWGLGTRAVDPYGGDYPRLVALSHPDLRSEVDPSRIRRYSQRNIDLIDLQGNEFRTLSISDVIETQTAFLQFIAQQYSDNHLNDFVTKPLNLDKKNAVITFDGLLGRTDLPDISRRLLQTLENAYHRPVDIEFVIELTGEHHDPPLPIIHLLQCRPQSWIPSEDVIIPKDLPQDRRVFACHGMVPDGRASGIRYAVFVDGESYFNLDENDKKSLARLIGRINKRLSGESFMLIGPGRWGSVNLDTGIGATYAELYNAQVLIETVNDDTAIEPSYGTHFFQDLVESGIFILAISLSNPDTEFNDPFFYQSQNVLSDLMPEEDRWSHIVRIIDIPAVANGMTLNLVMNGDSGSAIAYLKQYE
ncbi:MAG: hypothetical protein GTO18_17650 [Anaerolineales bacterium]|nr:hypothetical protein [Anaerolineales bacterium]